MSVTLTRMGDRRKVSAGLLPAIVVVGVLTLGAGSVQAKLRVVASPSGGTSSATEAVSAQAGVPTTDIPAADVPTVGFPVLVVPRDLSALAAGVQQVIASSGASV